MLYSILLTASLLAVNFYAFHLVKSQRDACATDEAPRGQDGKLLLAAMLGGATAIYAAMFALRFRLNDIVPMILIPVIAVCNIYLFFLGFRGIHLYL